MIQKSIDDTDENKHLYMFGVGYHVFLVMTLYYINSMTIDLQLN